MYDEVVVPFLLKFCELGKEQEHLFPDFAGFGEQTPANTGFSSFTSHYKTVLLPMRTTVFSIVPV